MPLFDRLPDDDFAYLTTVGRKTGRPHRIEIWFAVDGRRLYLLAGDGDKADWVKNIRENAKYMDWKPGRKLSSWARGAVPVAIDL